MEWRNGTSQPVVAPYLGSFVITSPQQPGRTVVQNGVTISSGNHNGIDMVGRSDKRLFATVNGTVTGAGWFGNSAGNGVDIRETGTNRVHRHFHMASVAVRSGQQVTIGTHIGLEGSTGASTGSHVHYEIRPLVPNDFNVTSRYSGIPNRRQVSPVLWSDLPQVRDIVLGGGNLGDWGIVQDEINRFPLFQTSAFQEPNTREDALIREVAFVNRQNQPSINMSDIRLSSINYTTVLSLLVGMAGPHMSSSFILDNVQAVARQVVQFFQSNGYSTAIGVGFAAHMQSMTSFNVAATYQGVGMFPRNTFGILQWAIDDLNRGRSRAQDMKDFCIRYNNIIWSQNLSGQLGFILQELDHNSDISTGRQLRSAFLANNAAGASNAADIIFDSYWPNRQHNDDLNRQRRDIQDRARELWEQVVPILPATGRFQ